MVELHFKAAVCPCATAAISQLINQLMDRKYFSNYICVLVVFCFGLVWFFSFSKNVQTVLVSGFQMERFSGFLCILQ